MSFRIKKKDAEFIKGITRQLQRGYLSIMESEQSIACYITEITESIEDMEARIAEQETMWRHAWKLLLEATK